MSDEKVEKAQAVLTPAERMALIRRNLTETWLRNLMAETALPLMGHVLLGEALTDDAVLNDKSRYVQLLETDYDAAAVKWTERKIYECSLDAITAETTVSRVMANIRSQLTTALSAPYDKVVARSLRLLVSHEPDNGVPTVNFTLAWLTYRSKND